MIPPHNIIFSTRNCGKTCFGTMMTLYGYLCLVKKFKKTKQIDRLQYSLTMIQSQLVENSVLAGYRFK